MKLVVALPAPTSRPNSPLPLSRELRWLWRFSFPNLRMARRVQFNSANGETSVENNDPRRVHRATMDAPRPAFGAVGCVPQIGLAEIPLQEWETQMRGGRKRCDIRGPGRRTCSCGDDERWCGVHRFRRIHKALAGNAGETEPTLDSQIYEMLVANMVCA